MINATAKVKEVLTPEKVNQLLVNLYDYVLDGIPRVSKPVDQFTEDYLCKNKDVPSAAKSMINYQLLKCTSAGFLTSFGGFLAMPITVPADISSVLYVQLRMVASLASMAGCDLKSDQVRTVIYATLIGVSVSSIFKSAGVKVGEKITLNLIKKIPGKFLTKINHVFGFRFITKAGTTGIVNLTKAVPVVGGFVGGGFDLYETKVIANRAYKLFINGEDFSNDKGVVDIDDIEVEEVEQEVID